MWTIISTCWTGVGILFSPAPFPALLHSHHPPSCSSAKTPYLVGTASGPSEIRDKTCNDQRQQRGNTPTRQANPDHCPLRSTRSHPHPRCRRPPASRALPPPPPPPPGTAAPPASAAGPAPSPAPTSASPCGSSSPRPRCGTSSSASRTRRGAPPTAWAAPRWRGCAARRSRCWPTRRSTTGGCSLAMATAMATAMAAAAGETRFRRQNVRLPAPGRGFWSRLGCARRRRRGMHLVVGQHRRRRPRGLRRRRRWGLAATGRCGGRRHRGIPGPAWTWARNRPSARAGCRRSTFRPRCPVWVVLTWAKVRTRSRPTGIDGGDGCCVLRSTAPHNHRRRISLPLRTPLHAEHSSSWRRQSLGTVQRTGHVGSPGCLEIYQPRHTQPGTDKHIDQRLARRREGPAATDADPRLDSQARSYAVRIFTTGLRKQRARSPKTPLLKRCRQLKTTKDCSKKSKC
ncbi:hypothetical protein BT67DRAFT_493857 [Trichocladium antarcticum]|uniref:Uncharacterized protein n=1 Tax=Trichocladium antarcticum TaxID=1450529 RepID=A0AAN6Z9B3_9PEZI|nr:hypothetical protein BT67DRAFT_493857 [Trichocladium antarcticum]